LKCLSFFSGKEKLSFFEEKEVEWPESPTSSALSVFHNEKAIKKRIHFRREVTYSTFKEHCMERAT